MWGILFVFHVSCCRVLPVSGSVKLALPAGLDDIWAEGAGLPLFYVWYRVDCDTDPSQSTSVSMSLCFNPTGGVMDFYFVKKSLSLFPLNPYPAHEMVLLGKPNPIWWNKTSLQPREWVSWQSDPDITTLCQQAPSLHNVSLNKRVAEPLPALEALHHNCHDLWPLCVTLNTRRNHFVFFSYMQVMRVSNLQESW